MSIENLFCNIQIFKKNGGEFGLKVKWDRLSFLRSRGTLSYGCERFSWEKGAKKGSSNADTGRDENIPKIPLYISKLLFDSSSSCPFTNWFSNLTDDEEEDVQWQWGRPLAGLMYKHRRRTTQEDGRTLYLGCRETIPGNRLITGGHESLFCHRFLISTREVYNPCW